jgi:hypothetical protein
MACNEEFDKEVFQDGKAKANSWTGTNSRAWKENSRDAELERDILKKAIGIFSKTVDDLQPLKTMKRYFRLKRCAKFYKLVKELLSMEKPTVSIGNKRVVFVVKK